MSERNFYKNKYRGKNYIVVGLDQSYKDTGISISMNGRLKTATHCFTDNLPNNTEKRKALKKMLDKTFSKAIAMKAKHNAKLICCIERIRLKSQGFINIDYIKSIGALNALIVDTAMEYGIQVYSADTRSWKSNVVGTSRGKPNPYGLDEKKFPTIEWCIYKGYDKYIRKYDVGKIKKGIIYEDGIPFTYNDNICDSICISLYPFISGHKLKREH